MSTNENQQEPHVPETIATYAGCAALILGESGTGKTASLRNLDPAKCLLIQPVRKPLPFRSKGWTEMEVVKTANGYKVTKGGNVLVTDDPKLIAWIIKRTKKEIVVVDDWQYILSLMFMSRRYEKGYDKFTEIAGAGYDICKEATEATNGKRVYILAHTQTDDLGQTRIKTLGKLLDDKIVVEGLFTVVLRTHVDSGRYLFSTQNSGSDTVKSPMGLFDAAYIENDLAAVDAAICDYYGIPTESETETTKE